MSTAAQPNSTLANAANQRGMSMPPPISSPTREGVRHPLAQAGDRGVVHGHALSIIKKLQICLDEETAILSASNVPDLDSFNHRKGQGLMELNRALSGFGIAARSPEIESELATLKSKIDENMRLLRLHISAVNEITVLLTDAIQKEDSDGTYSPSIRAQWK